MSTFVTVNEKILARCQKNGEYYKIQRLHGEKWK